MGNMKRGQIPQQNMAKQVEPYEIEVENLQKNDYQKVLDSDFSALGRARPKLEKKSSERVEQSENIQQLCKYKSMKLFQRKQKRLGMFVEQLTALQSGDHFCEYLLKYQ